ncbi:8268_t:CDS:2, partial [Cetraspora pellucida]
MALSKEWSDLKDKWLKCEEKVIIKEYSNNDVKKLLDNYHQAILTHKDNLKKTMATICRNILEEEEDFNDEKHLELLWIQSIHKILIYNPLICPDFKELAYRSHIVDRLLNDAFLDLRCIQVITGEIDNDDRKEQIKNSKGPVGVGWKHDITYYIKVNNMKFRICVGEVVSNAFTKDVKKEFKDRSKIFDAMQLSLRKLRSALAERNVDPKDINLVETYGVLIHRKTFTFYAMHYQDDAYLVDKMDLFSLPEDAYDLRKLHHIIERILCFKDRIINTYKKRIGSVKA